MIINEENLKTNRIRNFINFELHFAQYSKLRFILSKGYNLYLHPETLNNLKNKDLIIQLSDKDNNQLTFHLNYDGNIFVRGIQVEII